MTKDEAREACEQLRLTQPQSAWVYCKDRAGEWGIVECKDEPSYFLEKHVDDDGHVWYRPMVELGEVTMKIAEDQDPDDGVEKV